MSFVKALTVLVLALAAIACAPTAPDSEDSAATDAVLLPVADDPTVSFTLWFKAGSQNDPTGKEGLAALTGALLSDGSTTANSYEEVLQKLYPLASGYSVSVDKEMTVVSGRTHRDNLEAYFALFQDAYLRPAFTEEDFARLRSDAVNFLEKTLRFASDEELAKAALTESVFTGTSYRHPTTGTVAGLQAITLEDVRGFYKTYYTRANAVIGLGGGFEDSLVERFAASLDALSEEETPAAPSIAPAAVQGRRVHLVSKPGADASISFGFPITARRGERDFYALWLANSWLGEHRNSASHLYKVIRETRGMNYGDYSYIESFPNGGRRQVPPSGVGRQHQIFEIWIRTLPNDQALFALRGALRELEKLVTDGISKEDFELTRSFLSKYYLHFAETTRARLGYRIDDRFYGIDGAGHLSRFGEIVPTLTHEEVNAAIRKYLQLDNMTIAIVTGEADKLREAMLADTPSPMSYGSPKPEEVLLEDKAIEAFPLRIAEDGVATVAVEEIFAQ